MSRPLRAGARWWDAAALTLVLAGAALYLLASSGMRGIITDPTRRPSVEQLNLRRADRWRFTSYGGVMFIVAGIALGVYSYRRARHPGDTETR